MGTDPRPALTRRAGLGATVTRTHPRPALTRRACLGAAGSLLLGASGCGWILYPERRGNTRGRVDIGVLIVDLLWLLPGIAPGAVCLAVDFTTGAIYRNEPRSGRSQETTDRGLVRAQVDLDGQVIAEGRGRPGTSLALRGAERIDLQDLRARAELRVDADPSGTASAPVRDLLP